MNKRLLLIIIGVVLMSSACGRVGLGLPACATGTDDPTAATVLALQAVPTADYAPCINSLQLGWDDVDYEIESGLATLEIGREFSAFLEVRLTESCDVGNAVEVPSEVEDLQKFEDIVKVDSTIRLTIIPTGERPRIHALTMAGEMEGIRIEGRPLMISVDENIDFSVRSRVNEALFTDDYVWIVSDLDIEEDTLELRRTADGEGARGLSVKEALDRIEDMTPEVSYVGQWYLVFNGGCITYDFDARGTVAETIEQDVHEAIGLYPNDELREAGRRAGYTFLDN